MSGNFVFVDEWNDEIKLSYDLTSELEVSYKTMKDLYDSIEYITSNNERGALQNYEDEIINKYELY